MAKAYWVYWPIANEVYFTTLRRGGKTLVKTKLQSLRALSNSTLKSRSQIKEKTATLWFKRWLLANDANNSCGLIRLVFEWSVDTMWPLYSLLTWARVSPNAQLATASAAFSTGRTSEFDKMLPVRLVMTCLSLMWRKTIPALCLWTLFTLQQRCSTGALSWAPCRFLLPSSRLKLQGVFANKIITEYKPAAAILRSPVSLVWHAGQLPSRLFFHFSIL